MIMYFQKLSIRSKGQYTVKKGYHNRGNVI